MNYPMKFLIQTNAKKQVIHDFSFTLLQSLDFHRWKGTKISFELWNKPLSDMSDKDLSFWIPVGSVEFVEHHLAHFHGFIPAPINVPKALYDFAGRDIVVGYKSEVDIPIFAKSIDRVKKFADCIEDDYSFSLLSDYKQYQFSSVVNILSEWRGFVYQGCLLDIRNYSGDFAVFPDISKVKTMISEWSDAPEAYTIDVYVNSRGTFVLECHDFFSVGFYGFEDMVNIPRMFASWFRKTINV